MATREISYNITDGLQGLRLLIQDWSILFYTQEGRSPANTSNISGLKPRKAGMDLAKVLEEVPRGLCYMHTSAGLKQRCQLGHCPFWGTLRGIPSSTVTSATLWIRRGWF